jgi:hypothetical protein
MDARSMNELKLQDSEVRFLLTPEAIRERAAGVFEYTSRNMGHFTYHEDRFQPAVDYVLQTIRKNYPNGGIPFHSRWGHFRAGGIDRAKNLKAETKTLDPLERARLELDLVITSVLLDAGAGAEWKFKEDSGGVFNRSEGLGVASFHMFLSGAMSSDRQSRRADGQGLKSVREEELRRAFQVGPGNPLLGVEGRVQLLNNLGKAVENRELFKDGRPGNIIDRLVEVHGQRIPATGILSAVLEGFGSIWPGRLSANGVELGDVWRHSKLGAGDVFKSLIPFHKLSQWMTYSLIEPIQDAGLKVTGVEQLTGLAEYRNGGLLLDSGLIQLRDPEQSRKAWRPESDLVIEWRALTVHLLDRIGAAVQKSMNLTSEQFPLAKVLEGGTWWAGRFLAKEKRGDGSPPLQIESDGTVF